MNATATQKVRLPRSTAAFWIPHACQLYAHLTLAKATSEVRTKTMRDHVGKHFRQCFMNSRDDVEVLVMQPLMSVQVITVRYYPESGRWECWNATPATPAESVIENFDPFNGFEFMER